MQNRPLLIVIACALMSTGMSCTRQRSSAPPVPVSPVDNGPVANESDVPPPKPLPAGVEDTGVFNVRLETTKGDIVIEVHPAWAPLGAARFRELVESGFYKDCAFFRVVPGFIVQWGMNADPVVHAKWADNNLVDDPVLQSNQKGYVTFANGGANSRSTQVFINYADNSRLEQNYPGFAPLGMVVEGLDNAFAINDEYLEQPDQGRIRSAGNDYLKSAFPNLDYINRASIEKTAPSP
jgi:cyclophilin family peptidyl-prolyl cis-trans isomerase